MAKNREPVKPVETESGSSDEEDDSSSSEQVESDLEKGLGPNKKPSSLSLKNSQFSQPLTPDSSDEEDSEDDSDSDPESSKLVVGKQLKPKPTTTEPLTPAKRPAEGKISEGKEDKKLKKKPEPVPEKKVAESNFKAPNKNPNSAPDFNSGDSSKKVLFQRLWSEDDEIVILKGMLEYGAKTKSSTSTDMDAFLEYIKKNLHVDVSRTQLQDKIRRLKKKFEKNKIKDRAFTKPHEKAAYELSEKIWGNEIGKEMATLSTKANVNAVKKTPTKKANTVENGGNEAAVEVSNGALEEKLLVGKSVSSCGLTTEEKMLRIGAELFEGNDEIEGSKEWKKLEREDMELSLKKMDVMRAKMRLVLDMLK